MIEEHVNPQETEGEEPVVELVPARRAALPRVVGPGRKERAYLERQAELEAALARSTRELAVLELLERGAQRAANRLERERETARDEVARLDAEGKRLLVALGALQRENELLRERLLLTEGPGAARALPAPIARPTSPARGGTAARSR